MSTTNVNTDLQAKALLEADILIAAEMALADFEPIQAETLCEAVYQYRARSYKSVRHLTTSLISMIEDLERSPQSSSQDLTAKFNFRLSRPCALYMRKMNNHFRRPARLKDISNTRVLFFRDAYLLSREIWTNYTEIMTYVNEYSEANKFCGLLNTAAPVVVRHSWSWLPFL